MITASIIDIVLTPAAGGVGGGLAMLWHGKNNPQVTDVFGGRTRAALIVGSAAFVVLLALKLLNVT